MKRVLNPTVAFTSFDVRKAEVVRRTVVRSIPKDDYDRITLLVRRLVGAEIENHFWTRGIRAGDNKCEGKRHQNKIAHRVLLLRSISRPTFTAILLTTPHTGGLSRERSDSGSPQLLTDTWLYKFITEARIGRTIVTSVKGADFLKREVPMAQSLA